MWSYILRRVLQALVFIFLISVLIFSMIHIVPGDPVLTILGDEGASQEKIQALRTALKLDRPLPVQFFDWIGAVVRGDLGESLISGRSITPDILTRLPRTFELIFLAIILSLLVGIPLGILAAVRRNHALDWLISLSAMLGLSTPVFVTGTLLTLLFSLRLQWFPSTGYVSFQEDPLAHLQRLILPSISLATTTSAIVMRMMRSSVLEVISLDYIRTSRAKGLNQAVTLYKHVLRNAVIPVVAIIGVQVSTLIGGTVLIEYIFNWPGLSSMLIKAISQRDYPTVQGVVLFISSLVIFINLLVDLSYGMLDPRVRYT
ncbi:MAG: ABC transporter permease [Trueperaceae bacterium]|nr:ABC transporter permease [Trueperaceae bacterium]